MNTLDFLLQRVVHQPVLFDHGQAFEGSTRDIDSIETTAPP
jgi:hypothetical protein